MLQSGTSGTDHTQQSIQLCIGLLLKDLYFSRSLSPSLAFTSLMLSPLPLGVEDPGAAGQWFLSRVYHSIKSSWHWHFSLVQAELESAATQLWNALQKWCEAEFISGWDSEKVGLDVQEVPLTLPPLWTGGEGVSAGGIERQPESGQWPTAL